MCIRDRFRDRVVIRVPKYNDRLYSILMYKGSLYVVTGNIISFACVGGGVASSLLRVSSNPCQKKERGVRALTRDACAKSFFFSLLFVRCVSLRRPAGTPSRIWPAWYRISHIVTKTAITCERRGVDWSVGPTTRCLRHHGFLATRNGNIIQSGIIGRALQLQ